MTARNRNGRAASENPHNDATPTATTPASGRHQEPAPASTLSGAFRTALGKPVQTPAAAPIWKGDKGLKSAANPGPVHGQGRQASHSPTPAGPRKGHR
ncbi:hypothetical protein [Nitratireductor pacificus]|uniref:hypothetical protein n=1 Tax=Nitratireductor pacificus TaxID=1231180 RepID=UPI00178C30FD|nr:hypothetical protein [Nitratireductor pacificus]